MSSYEIWRDGSKVKEIPFTTQSTTDPFSWSETLNDRDVHTYVLKVTDAKGRIAESDPVTLGIA
ncbi:MAG: hypothetical protein R6W81_04905 [Bacteroidales bacterium]